MDKDQYERGVDAAPLIDNIIMLLPDLLTAGWTKLATTGVKQGVKLVGRQSVKTVTRQVVRVEKQVAPGGNPLRATAGTPSGAASPLGNITRPVTIQELLADSNLVPGMRGAYVEVPVGGRNFGIRFEDISQLTINHGAEFMLTRETVYSSNRQIISARYRIYSGTPDQILLPAFRRLGPNGEVTVERIIGHSHPHPVPFQPGWNQLSGADINYLLRVRADWQRVYGPNSEPFGRIFGDPGDPAVIYGPRSTHGNAVPRNPMRKYQYPS